MSERKIEAVTERNWLGHRSEVAFRKAGSKPGWLPFRIERIGGEDALITGGVPSGRHKNGRPKWSKPYDVVCVTQAEMRAEEERYEASTGNCARCEGSGQLFASWSVSEGTKHRPCRICNSTGRALPTPEPRHDEA